MEGEQTPYVLTAVLAARGLGDTDPTVMVTCCDYGMSVRVPSQAIKVLAPDAGGVLRYSFGAYAAAVSIPDLDLVHGQLRDLWLSAKPGSLSQSDTPVELHVVIQYFNAEDVTHHNSSLRAKLESVFRKRTQELTYGGQKASTTTVVVDHESATTITPQPDERENSKDQVDDVYQVSAQLQVPQQGVADKRVEDHVVQGATRGGAIDHVQGGSILTDPSIEELTWQRCEPYRKIIQALEAKVSKLEEADREHKGKDEVLEEQKELRRQGAVKHASVLEKTSASITTLRRDYDTLLAENQNLLKQLQEATRTIYEGREQQEELVKTVGKQKAELLLLETKLRSFDHVTNHLQSYKGHDQEHNVARQELHDKYNLATQAFETALAGLKKEVSTLGEEKVALQLRLDEREMQLESTKFSLESLQLTSHGNDAERQKNYRLENSDDMTSLRKELLAANTRRDQLEAEFSLQGERARSALQAERREQARLREELDKSQAAQSALFLDLTQRQEQASSALLARKHAEGDLLRLQNDIADLSARAEDSESKSAALIELRAELTQLTRSFDELRICYGKETQRTQADIIPSMKRELGTLRKETRQLQEELVSARARGDLLENEKREMQDRITVLENSACLGGTGDMDEGVYQMLREKEGVCAKQQTLLNRLAERLKELSASFDSERNTLQRQATFKDTLLKKLTDLALTHSTDLEGRYLPDKMDMVDSSLGAMVNSRNGGQLPIVRIGRGQYLYNSSIYSASFDERGGRLMLRRVASLNAGAKGDAELVSAEELLFSN
ncbi:unnamed protein product [Amoebophrya sp. A25]|nr:unnamed protein product [Amoebophrya sp. A25]|eukprot:GSA25T00014985001.1